MHELLWYKSSLKDLKTFPVKVREHAGFALYTAQCGELHLDAKPLKGMPGVMEIVSWFDTNTYRTVYYTKIKNKVVVLHCFQKKSKSGIATPPFEIDMIRKRLKEAQEHYG